ncbi:MAG: class I SAM-dependent methyltransferase [Actinomycetota bacterium]
MKTTWGLGDYPAMAELLLPAATVLLDALDVKPGERVLDLACGTGNAAILAAHKGARVVGVDLEPALLEIAAGRAAEKDLVIEWIEVDARAAPFPPASFDVVLSVFGVMYVPDQRQAVRSVTRLCRRGGIIGLTAWAPNGFMPAMGRVLAPFLPPLPPGSYPPERWGDEAWLSGLFGAEGIHSLRSARRTIPLHFEDVQEARDLLVATAGHVIAQRPRLLEEGKWNDLLADLSALVRQSNRAHGLGVTLNLDYLATLVQMPD